MATQVAGVAGAQAGAGAVRSRSSLRRISAITGLVFISPWIIGFILFKLIPILAALGFSFTYFHMLTPEETHFIGLENYVTILQDRSAGASLVASVGSVLFAVPVEMALALGVAENQLPKPQLYATQP